MEDRFTTSFGFAALIEINEKKILFDTGTESETLLNNLGAYNVNIPSLDAVILSHNHYDHTDGLPGILKRKNDVPVYVHKYWDRPVSSQGIDVPRENRIVINEARECREISKGIFVTNALLSRDYGGIHEQACFIKADNSYILLCGCCHPGISAFLNERSILGIPEKAPLYIIGGFHGFKFTDEEAKQLYPQIKSIICCHCTQNGNIFKKQFKNKCISVPVGKKLIFS